MLCIEILREVIKLKKIAYIAASLNNYGSQLQTYALYQVMLRYNIVGEVFRYDANIWRKLPRILKIETINKLAARLKKNSKDSMYVQYQNQIKIRNNCFEKYKQECGFYLPKTNSRKKIKKRVQMYSGVVLGSDQVWNPINLDLDFYTLGFVPENMIKITYASSFGVSEIPKNQIKKTKTYLSRIQYISVREVSGSRIVYELIQRKVPVVCDPTALLTAQEWENYSRPYIIDNKYVLCYFLGHNKAHREYAKKIAKQYGLKIVCIPHIEYYTTSDVGYADIEVYNADPRQFVSLIKNASLVLTDSFHATMFSIYFNKKFFTFYRYNETDIKSANSRITTVLHRLELTAQLINTNNVNLKMADCVIDWEGVENRLSQWKEESLKFFEGALSKGGLIDDNDQ